MATLVSDWGGQPRGSRATIARARSPHTAAENVLALRLRASQRMAHVLANGTESMDSTRKTLKRVTVDIFCKL